MRATEAAPGVSARQARQRHRPPQAGGHAGVTATPAGYHRVITREGRQ
jgi:hypothetical protein